MNHSKLEPRVYDLLYPVGSGKPVRSREVGKFVSGWQCEKKCKPPKEIDYSSSCLDYAYPRNTSCIHTTGWGIGLLKRLKWDSDEVLDLLTGSDTFMCFAWLRAQDDAEEKFMYLWENSYTTDETRRDREVQISQGKSKQRKQFVARYHCWVTLLDYLEANPGIGRNELLKAMPWRDGTTKEYLRLGKERGYIEDRPDVAPSGKVTRSHLYVIGRPTEPRVTHPRWNQPREQREFWTRVRAVPALDAMSEDRLVELYESGDLERLVKAWEREQKPSVEVEEQKPSVEVEELVSELLGMLDAPGYRG